MTNCMNYTGGRHRRSHKTHKRHRMRGGNAQPLTSMPHDGIISSESTMSEIIGAGDHASSGESPTTEALMTSQGGRRRRRKSHKRKSHKRRRGGGTRKGMRRKTARRAYMTKRGKKLF